jgi:MFS family permease
MFLTGILLDKFGTVNLIPYFQLPLVVAFLLFSFGEGLFSALVGFVFLGLTSGAFATLPNAFWAAFFGTKHLRSIKEAAVAVMVQGSAIGPALTSFLLDFNLSLENQYVWISAFLLSRLF